MANRQSPLTPRLIAAVLWLPVALGPGCDSGGGDDEGTEGSGAETTAPGSEGAADAEPGSSGDAGSDAGTTTQGTDADSGTDTSGGATTGDDAGTGGDGACGSLPSTPADWSHAWGDPIGSVDFLGETANCGFIIPAAHTLNYSLTTSDGVAGVTLGATFSLIGTEFANFGAMEGKSLPVADAAAWGFDLSPGPSMKKYVSGTDATFHVVEVTDTLFRACITGIGPMDTSPPSGEITPPAIIPIVCAM